MALFKKIGIYSVSLLGAIGTGLQNYIAVASLVKDLMNLSVAGTKVGLSMIHGIAILLGGVCSGLVNLCVNIELLENFLERVTKKQRPKLQGWQKFRYWAGSGLFIGTGILFGLTTFAFGGLGVLAALGIAAGIFVAAIMIIQELETWLESFDDQISGKKKSLTDIFYEWKASLTKGKILGIVIAVGNVVALSLLFTLGLTSFLATVGVPALPALIIGLVVAFTGGAFTEFYFYNRFLSSFCANIKENWQKIKETKYPVIGLTCGGLNAIVNSVLCYVGIMMISSLVVAAGIAVPPVGVMIAVAATAALFAGLASFILGLDFWVRNSSKLTNYFSSSKPEAKPESSGNTASMLSKLSINNSDSSLLPCESHDSRLLSCESHDSRLLSCESHDSSLLSCESHDSSLLSYESHDSSLLSCQHASSWHLSDNAEQVPLLLDNELEANKENSPTAFFDFNTSSSGSQSTSITKEVDYYQHAIGM